MKMLKVAAALVAVLAAIFLLWFLIFGRVPFDGDASPVAESNVHDELAAALSQESFGTAPDTLYYSVTNNGGTPVGVFRHASIERLVDGQWRVLKMNLKNSNIADSDDMWYCSEIKPGERTATGFFSKRTATCSSTANTALLSSFFLMPKAASTASRSMSAPRAASIFI